MMISPPYLHPVQIKGNLSLTKLLSPLQWKEFNEIIKVFLDQKLEKMYFMCQVKLIKSIKINQIKLASNKIN